jgi:hypothetical protein
MFVLSTVALSPLVAAQGLGASRPTQASEEIEQDAKPSLIPMVRVELPPQKVQLANGETEDFGPHEIWRPMCTGTDKVTQQSLEHMVRVHEHLSQNPVTVIDTGAELNGFNIVFVLSGSVPAGASAALAAAETYIESFFSDPITITINCSFQPLGPGILGGTGSSYGYVSYSGMRAQLVSDMDANDTIQSSLPSGTTLPVRYTTGSTITNENRVFTTYANWKAADGAVSGVDANMTFSTNFSFDYDPSNGVGGSSYSFRDIVIHETGHAMGFTSGGDFRSNDLEVLDLYRFQRTDGTGDYNPDTLAEFTARPRLVRFNAPNDDHNSDLISIEYRMSDGSPHQMSHFREQTANIGLMDPALAPGQTFYPAYFSTADLTMFDAIGYDR